MDGRVIQVRQARPEDASRLSALLAASYAAVYPAWYGDAVLAAALPSMATARPELLSSGRYFVAECDGKAVACGGWSVERPGTVIVEPGLGHARHFATDPDFLRRGIGGAILDLSIARARAAGCVEMECDSSLPAERFYAAHGFIRVGARDILVSGAYRFAVVRMRRHL